MTLLIWFLVFAVIIIVVVWAIQYLASKFGTPPQIVAIIYVALVVIVIVILYNKFPALRL
jgi:hypothetical protein